MMRHAVKGRVNGRHPFPNLAVLSAEPLQQPDDVRGMAASDAERIGMPYKEPQAAATFRTGRTGVPSVPLASGRVSRLTLS